MINFFRKPKWQIIYVEEAGVPKKGLIVTAKTIEQAKEKFHQLMNGKKIRTVTIKMLP